MRFIYLRPREWYVRIQPAPTSGRQSVIEHMSADRVLDLVGWDLRKALGLLCKSNPPLLEHLHSPIVYQSSPQVDELRTLAARYYSPARCLSHYLHMAGGNFRDYLQGERVRTRSGCELDDGPRIPPLSTFLEQELARLRNVSAGLKAEPAATEPLDDYFRRVAGFN